MAGKIIADQIEHSTAGSIATNYVVEGTAKVWTAIQQTGTMTVLDSFGQSSVTDNGTGKSRVNYSNAFTGSTTQSITSFNSYEVNGSWYAIISTTACDLVSYSGGYIDVGHISGHIFGDLV